MISIFDELAEKTKRESSAAVRSGPRQDLGVLLYSQREAIGALWKAADRCAARGDEEARAALRAAVDALRPFFGER